MNIEPMTPAGILRQRRGASASWPGRGARGRLTAWRARWPDADGLTLLEIVIVLAVLGILAGLLLPRLDAFLSREDHKTAARRLSQALAEARQAAIVSRAPRGLVVDIATGRFWSGPVRSGRPTASGFQGLAGPSTLPDPAIRSERSAASDRPGSAAGSSRIDRTDRLAQSDQSGQSTPTDRSGPSGASGRPGPVAAKGKGANSSDGKAADTAGASPAEADREAGDGGAVVERTAATKVYALPSGLGVETLIDPEGEKINTGHPVILVLPSGLVAPFTVRLRSDRPEPVDLVIAANTGRVRLVVGGEEDGLVRREEIKPLPLLTPEDIAAGERAR